MQGIALLDAANQFIAGLANDYPELKGVTVRSIAEPVAKKDGWLEFELTLSNGNKMPFEVRIPRKAMH